MELSFPISADIITLSASGTHKPAGAGAMGMPLRCDDAAVADVPHYLRALGPSGMRLMLITHRQGRHCQRTSAYTDKDNIIGFLQNRDQTQTK